MLSEFAARFREIFHRHGTDGAFYGHASVGCLHIRPVLNFHDPSDVVTMRRIMEDVTDLVLNFNGSLSGEHGDGLVRSEWNRKMFGPRVYEAFRQVKRGFDPENVLNPGKVVDAPAMEANWRAKAARLAAGRSADGAGLLETGRLLQIGRGVQWLGCLPQDARRRDVPELPRDAGRTR